VDVEAHFERFVRGSTDSLFRTAVLLTADVGDAQELLQDVLVRLYPKWAKVAATRSPLAYVRRSLVNRYVSGRRSPARLVRHLREGDDRGAPSDDFTQLIDRAQLTDLLAPLSPKQRAAIVLRYFEDLPDDEIASIVGCKPATVRSLVSRGLLVMRGRVPTNAIAPPGGSRGSRG